MIYVMFYFILLIIFYVWIFSLKGKNTSKNKGNDNISKKDEKQKSDYVVKGEDRLSNYDITVKEIENENYNYKENSYYLMKLYNAIVSRKGYLIHVTEYGNLKSIIDSKNIYSNYLLNNKKMHVNFISNELSQTLDNNKELNKYVHLAYDESYDMFAAKVYYKQIREPVILKIKPEIIFKYGTLFSDTNSTSNCARIDIIDNIYNYLNFDKIYFKNVTWDDKNINKKYKQAEILVKDRIELSYINEIIIPYGKQNIFREFSKITYSNTIDDLSFKPMQIN